MIGVLAVGDVVGRPGRHALAWHLPRLRAERAIDVVVVNAENAAAGSGITPKLWRELKGLGVDVITMGDHAFKRRESLPLHESEPTLLRPANWPAAAPGRGRAVVTIAGGVRVAVVHLQGRAFMGPADDLLEAADREVDAARREADVVVVDLHAEATSEKVALSWHLDGRAALLFGTHTHVPTADATIRPQGLGYITDCGMTGPYAGVIGRSAKAVLAKMRTGVHHPFEVAQDDARLGAVWAEVDPVRGITTRIEGLWRPVDEGAADAVEASDASNESDA